MRFAIPLIAASLATFASADFFISNTTVCMGSFIIQSCVAGVQVLSETKDLSGKQNATDYKCNALSPAQDHHYIQNGTMGKVGADVWVEGGICDSGRLDFKQDGNGTYSVYQGDEHVGACTWDNKTVTRSCNEWVGVLYFQSSYKCTSSICD